MTKAVNIEETKRVMINSGGSIEAIRNYTFSRFEEIVSNFEGKNISVNMHGKKHEFCTLINFTLESTKDSYILKSNLSAMDVFENIDDLDIVVSSVKIEKAQILDVLFNIDEFEQEIVLLLIDGDEIVIDMATV